MEALNLTTTLQHERDLEWCVVSRALPGQSVSGDLHVVAASNHGTLLAVIDGLGHGEEATAAAQKAAGVLAQHAGDSLVSLMQRCHGALRDTRGAVMTLFAVERGARAATALGVGNVEAMVIRADGAKRESILLRNGVVGYQLPALQVSEVAIAPGDLVVFATDGVREDFADRVRTTDALPSLAERILAQKFRGTDDGLVFVGRFLDDHET